MQLCIHVYTLGLVIATGFFKYFEQVEILGISLLSCFLDGLKVGRQVEENVWPVA